MNVLSLFDGMSCGMVALNKVGINVKNYYASEIKPHAIKCSKENNENIIQIGDVTKVRYIDGVLYTENGSFEVGKIDIVIGGSPFQDFSHANKNIEGLKGLKSRLFYHYHRILNEINPKYFLLENVRMKKEHEDILTEYMGVKPKMIDASLVSPGLRKRMYWTNIPDVCQPKNIDIELKDILINGYTDRKKARCLLESDSRPLTTPVKMFHRYQKFLTVVFEDKTHFENCRDHYKKNFKGKSAKYIDEFIFKCGDVSIYNGIRHLNKTERERIQGVPKGYCDSLTENEAASLLGDGWNVDVIAHIFKGIKQQEV